MKRSTSFALVALLLIGVTFGGYLFRNFQLELAGRALNDDKGSIAVNYLTPLARIGDTSAQLLLGNIYAYGWAGVPRNHEEAANWIKRAGRFSWSRIDPSSEELGIARNFVNGTNGVSRDENEAAKWLRLSTDSGNKEAAQLLETLTSH